MYLNWFGDFPGFSLFSPTPMVTIEHYFLLRGNVVISSHQLVILFLSRPFPLFDAWHLKRRLGLGKSLRRAIPSQPTATHKVNVFLLFSCLVLSCPLCLSFRVAGPSEPSPVVHSVNQAVRSFKSMYPWKSATFEGMLTNQIRTLNIRKLSNFISGSKAIHWVVEFSAFFKTINLWSRHISLTVWFAHLKAGQPSHL